MTTKPKRGRPVRSISAVRSVHNADVRRFAEGGTRSPAPPSIAYGRALAGAGAFVTLLIILTLAVPALRDVLRPPPPLADVRAALPTAAAVVAPAAPEVPSVPTVAPAAPEVPSVPTVAPAAPEVPSVPTVAPAALVVAPAAPTAAGGYHQLPPAALAAGWTPDARDIEIAGGSWYAVRDEQVGPSCRIRVVTGSEPNGLAQTADVWVNCDQVEVQP